MYFHKNEFWLDNIIVGRNHVQLNWYVLVPLFPTLDVSKFLHVVFLYWGCMENSVVKGRHSIQSVRKHKIKSVCVHPTKTKDEIVDNWYMFLQKLSEYKISECSIQRNLIVRYKMNSKISSQDNKHCESHYYVK